MNDQFRIEILTNGSVIIQGKDDRVEPICAVCGEEILWCLDMFSFTTGFPHELAHARCVWTAEAFDVQRARSTDIDPSFSPLERLDVGYEARWHPHHDSYVDSCADCRRLRYRESL